MMSSVLVRNTQVQLPSGEYTSVTNDVIHLDSNGTATTGQASVPLTNCTRTVTGNTPEQVIHTLR